MHRGAHEGIVRVRGACKVEGGRVAGGQAGKGMGGAGAGRASTVKVP